MCKMHVLAKKHVGTNKGVVHRASQPNIFDD